MYILDNNKLIIDNFRRQRSVRLWRSLGDPISHIITYLTYLNYIILYNFKALNTKLPKLTIRVSECFSLVQRLSYLDKHYYRFVFNYGYCILLIILKKVNKSSNSKKELETFDWEWYKWNRLKFLLLFTDFFFFFSHPIFCKIITLLLRWIQNFLSY